MITPKLKHLLVILSLIALFVAPNMVLFLWSAPFMLVDKLSLLPAVLNAPQRLLLYGLWLGGTLYFSALMWVAITRRNKGYLAAAVAQVVFVIGITLFNVPIGEQNQRRWQSMNQLESPAWQDFLYVRDRYARFNHITQPFNQHNIIELFLARKKPLTELPLGWNEQDAAAADALWQQALGYREQEAKALTKMDDYLSWMPDRGDLTLATAILTLTTDANKAQAERAFRRAIAIAPENPDAWLGWALALIQSRDDEQVRNSQFQPFTQSITSGLLMAEGLKDSPRQPALQQRLEAYIAQMPAEDRQILHILRARMQTRSCDLPWDRYAAREQGEAGKVLPLSRSIVFKQGPVPGVSPVNERFPGHVSIEAEQYGIWKESLQNMPYPAINKFIKSATTVLSVDTGVGGDLLNAVVECSSGVPEFDKAALHYVQQWRFASNRHGERLLIPVNFISDRLPPEEHYREMESRAARIARLAARHNKAGMEIAAQEMVAQFTRMKALFPQKKLSAEEVRNLQLVYFKKRDKSPKGRMEGFTEMTEAMEALVDTHPYYAPLLKDLALRKSFASFDENRATWAQLLALAPEDPQVWMAWGSLWAERDPELYIGAMIYSLLLQPLAADTEQKIANIKTKLLMRVGMGERSAILSAKVYANYADILGERTKGEDTAKAGQILPPSKTRGRHETIVPGDFPRGMAVDIDRNEVLNASFFNVEWKAPQMPGDKRTELTVDIDKSGVPTLVLVSKSSEVEDDDARAVDMLWRWKFKPQPDGRQITVGVNFQH